MLTLETGISKYEPFVNTSRKQRPVLLYKKEQ